MKNTYPKISLVGAGPGDAELITVKGLKALKSADVVLYDALVNEELLNETPSHTLKIYVGKRANKHRFTQDTINQMLVQFAQSHGHVVRLKGGDPFVFGRGQEELAFAKKYGVEVQIVPGISTCISLPELQEVPVTCRGINESFWVLTGTTRAGKLSEDLKLAVKSTATLVILMGVKKLPAIAQLFQAEGKGETPVMVIQNGSRDNEKVAVGKINNIVKKVIQQQIGTPGIIVIGEVVSLHPTLAKERMLAVVN